VFREKPDSWSYGVSTPQHRRRLGSLLGALRNLAARGLTAAGVLAFLHHRRVVPLMATAPRRAPVAMEAQVEAPAEAAQGSTPADSSRAAVVEIQDVDSLPPGWDQWVSFPTLSSESQEGALVRRRDGHMVAGGRGHGAKASSSRAGHSAQVEGIVDDPPAFADAQGEQELWGELRSHGATLDRALNEALRVHGGPAWRVFLVGHRCSFSSFPRFCALSLYHDANGL
jgi:hypothetical protein